jgi:hypothetical protein
VLNYALANGISLPQDYESFVVNQTFSSIKSKDVWDKVLGWYCYGLANKDFSKINLRYPGTFNLTEQGTVNFTSKVGSRASNLSSYYLTGIDPTVFDVSSVGGKVENTATNRVTGGWRDTASNNLYVAPNVSGDVAYGAFSAQQTFTPPTYTGDALNLAQRNSFATVRNAGDVVLYMNGKEVARATTAAVAPVSREITGLAANDSSPTFVLTSVDGSYFFVLKDEPTDEDIFDFFWACEQVRSGIKVLKQPYSAELKTWDNSDVPDVYIISGQSNALGEALFTSTPDDYTAMNLNTWCLMADNSNFDQLNNGNSCAYTGLGARVRHGVEIKLSRLAVGTKPIYVIKCATGSTAVSPLLSPTCAKSAVGSRYDNYMQPIKRGLEIIDQRHGSYNLKGTIWIQGEADSRDLTAANDYRTNLNQFISDLETDIGVADLKFYCSKLSSASVANNTYYAIVNAHFDDMETAGEIEAAISAESLPLADGVHYTSAGYDELGQRFFDAINP